MLLFILTIAFAADPSPEPEPKKETREQLEERLIALPAKALKEAKTESDLIDRVFKGVLNRAPREEEQRKVLAYFDRKKDRLLVCQDVCWMLLNTNEFAGLYKMTIPEAGAFSAKITQGWSARKK